MKHQPESGFSLLELICIIAGVALIAWAGWTAYIHKPGSKSKPTAIACNLATNSQLNQWTGKGNNDNWSNAQNWTLGVPQDGQSLQIDADCMTGSHETGSVNDDIAGLSIAHLTILDQHNYQNSVFQIIGKELTVTGGIADQVTPADEAAILIYNALKLSGDQSVTNNSGANLDFIGSGIVIGTGSTVNFVTSNTREDQFGIAFDAPLVGSGTITMQGYIRAGTMENATSSPDFTGRVNLLASADVDMQGLKAFGNAPISVASGATLEIDSNNSTASFANALSLAGSGVQSNGALTSCLGSNCNPGTFSLTGKVILTGNTELGAVGSKSTTYSFASLDKAGYTLTGIPSSGVKIVQ